VRRLAIAIRAATGIEAFIWLVDIARVPREEAVQLLRWTGKALLRAALNGEPPPPDGTLAS
jgi:hypothetical protein